MTYNPQNPLIVQGDHTVLVEVDSSRYAEARDHLARFAELVKSPEHVHTYRMTPLSIWNASAAGLSAQQIASTLSEYAKYDVPDHVLTEIHEYASRYGRLKLHRRGDIRLLESYKARELSDADIRVILRGKALEFYSRHYGKVYTAEDAELSIRDALLGINQLLDENTGEPGERPPSLVQPVAYQFLRLFGGKASLSRDDVGKNLRGTGLVLREFVDRGWVEEKNKVVYRVPIKEQFEKTRLRPRKEMKTEIDQAHFLIGAALPDSGMNIEEELARNTWAVRRSVEAVLQWYAKTAVEPEIKDAAALAATLLRTSLEQRRAQLVHEQGFLFDDLEEVA
jgi:hypothetical protein